MSAASTAFAGRYGYSFARHVASLHSQPTFYNWKSKYGGMSPSELKRIKELEAEHAKLKRMVADLAMENDALKELIEKKL